MALTPAMKLEALSAPAPAGRSWSPEFLDETDIRPGEMVIEIPLDRIGRNPYQTRSTSPDDPALEELAESIKGQGVMQPVVVRPLKQAGPQGELYELIAGERRWLASRRAGKTHLPAIVREVPSEQVLVLTIIENLHREDLNPMQHARALERLAQEFHLTQEEVASRTGLARSAVANYLRLVRLSEELQQAVAQGRLGFGQAKVLLSLEPSARDPLARKVIASKLTVRETEALVQAYFHPKPAEAPDPPRLDPNVRAAEMELQRSLGCRVQIKDRNGKGKILIEYNSLEDFDRVLEALK
jgi:ParB family chromosome partitioning protein